MFLCSNALVDSTGAAVPELPWGTVVEGKAERGMGSFYKLAVSEEHVANGFLIQCKSAGKDKFKLLIFDGETGELAQHEDSLRSRDKTSTSATTFFTKFPVFYLGDAVTPEALAAANDDPVLPPLFGRLETLSQCDKTTAGGIFLVCVVGENMIGRSVFSLLAVPTKNDATEVIILSLSCVCKKCYYDKTMTTTMMMINTQ